MQEGFINANDPDTREAHLVSLTHCLMAFLLRSYSMSFWHIFRNVAVSDKGETITRLSDTMSVSSKGVTHTNMGNMTFGSDGSNFTQMGDFSTDGSVCMRDTTTGRGALFADKSDPFKTLSSDDSSW